MTGTASLVILAHRAARAQIELRKLRRPERGRVAPETHPRARRKATGFSTPVDSVDSRLDRVIVQNRTTIIGHPVDILEPDTTHLRHC